MYSINNNSSWSLEYVPPSIDYIANCKSECLVNRNSIEDGLCCPDDQKLFLTASMSFLHKHLMQKLKSNSSGKTTAPKRTYSDLLILENSPKLKQTKCYLKLKNIDEYDEVSRNEASIPLCALTLDQILPQPKKCIKRHTTIFKLLLRFPSSQKKRLKDKSQSADDLFNAAKHESPSTSSSTWKPPVQTLKLPTDVCVEIPAHCMSSLLINRMTMAPNFIKPTNHRKPVDCRYPSYISECLQTSLNYNNENKLLFARQRERKVLHEEISGTISLDKKQCEVLQEKNLYVKLGKDSEINVLTRRGAQTRLKQQLPLNGTIEKKCEVSKISCGFASTNFTDELKFKFSSDNF